MNVTWSLAKKFAKVNQFNSEAAVCSQELWCYLVFMNILPEHRWWRAVATCRVICLISGMRRPSRPSSTYLSSLSFERTPEIFMLKKYNLYFVSFKVILAKIQSYILNWRTMKKQWRRLSKHLLFLLSGCKSITHTDVFSAETIILLPFWTPNFGS